MSHRKHVLFFFGAGGSKPFELRTMRELVEDFEEYSLFGELRRLYETVTDSQTNWDIISQLSLRSPLPNPEAAFSYWLSTVHGLGYNTLDIEQVLGALRPSAQMYQGSLRTSWKEPPVYRAFVGDFFWNVSDEERQTRWEQAIEGVSEALTCHILTLIKRKCIVDPRIVQQKVHLLQPLFELFPSPSYAYDIATTNYDKVLEFALEQMGLQFDDPVDGNGIFDPDRFRLDSLKPEPKPLLLKVHGSIDLYCSGTTIHRIPSPDVKTLIDGTQVQEVMIYPFPKKDVETASGQGVYCKLRAILAAAIARASACVAVGYSFRDDHIRGMFEEALWKRPDFKMVLISPHAKAVCAAYPHLSHHRLKPVERKLEEITSTDRANVRTWCVSGTYSASP